MRYFFIIILSIFITKKIDELSSYSNYSLLMSSINAKNLWCRDTLFQKMNVSKYTRTCSYGETCKGAHTNEEIILMMDGIGDMFIA